MSELDRLLGGLELTPETRRELEQVLGLQPARRARKTGARPSQPISVEREYARITEAVASATEEAIRFTILEYVEGEVEADAIDWARAGRLLERLRDLMRRIQRLDVEEELGRVAERVVRWNATDMSSVLGIPVDSLDPRVLATLEPWRRRQAELIRGISEQMVERVQRRVERAQQSGQRAEELAQDIEEEFGIGHRRARTIAVDQVLTANARVTQERHRQAGVTHYEWSTSADDRVRPEHERLDGKVFAWSSGGAPGAGTKRGESAHPGEAIRCRCVAIPHFEEVEETASEPDPPPPPPPPNDPPNSPPPPPSPPGGGGDDDDEPVTPGGRRIGAQSTDPPGFADSFRTAMRDNELRAYVSEYSEEDLQEMEALVLDASGHAGVAVKNHGDGRIEATALFNRDGPPGAGRALLREVMARHGVNYVECYSDGPDDGLELIYSGLGFEVEARYPFDDSMAHPDWDYDRHGRPDYVIMRLRPAAPREDQ